MPFNRGEYKEVTSNFWKYNVIGDYIAGILTNVEEKAVKSPDGKISMQKVYELKCEAGEFHGREDDANGNSQVVETPVIIEPGEYYFVGGKPSIDRMMARIKLGQKVLLEFVESIPSKEKGKSAFKLVKVSAGEMDEQMMLEQAMDGKEINPAETA